MLAFNVERVPVHQLSLLGHGPIDTRRGVGTDYPLEAFATDIIEQMDARKIERCALVGHSLGALVASMVAQRQPERFDRVLLEDMPVLRRVRQDPPPMRRYVDTLIMEVAALAGRKRFDPKMVWKVSRELLKPNPQWWNVCARMAMPVLIIGGGKSSYLRQDRLRDVAKALPDARLTTIEGGHDFALLYAISLCGNIGYRSNSDCLFCSYPALFDSKENTIAKSHDAACTCPLFCDSGHDNEWWIPFA